MASGDVTITIKNDISLLGCLKLIFTCLCTAKLAGVTDASWWLVCAPLAAWLYFAAANYALIGNARRRN